MSGLLLPFQRNKFASNVFVVPCLPDAKACLLRAGFRGAPGEVHRTEVRACQGVIEGFRSCTNHEILSNDPRAHENMGSRETVVKPPCLLLEIIKIPLQSQCNPKLGHFAPTVTNDCRKGCLTRTWCDLAGILHNVRVVEGHRGICPHRLHL